MSLTEGKRKTLVFVLTAALILSMMPLTAFADMDNDHDRISVATGEAVTLQWDSSASTGGAIVTNSAIDYYPSSFVLYAYNTATTPSSADATLTYLYNTPGGDAYRVDLPSSASTISVTLADSEYGGNREYVLRCQAPQGVASGGATPSYVNGYLPIGQYASGVNWGSIFSDGTNLTGNTVKFLNGYESTGVSLGAGGGYVQFEFGSAVENKDTNPYGIDFVIYGNPFNGNPEAGAVKVSTDGAVWYDLAGSLYYDAKSKNNVDVSYKKVSTTSAAFTTKGIYYKIDNGSWTKFNTNTSTAWWPEFTAEGYGTVSGIAANFKGSTTVEGVAWNSPYEEITFGDVCLVKDTDTTNDYQFGYFDIRSNGSSYAAAVNPYATLPSANNGGDGFDISWAVNENGEPVALDSIKYVRAYTSACLNTTGDAFTVPSIFGETSAEVCGIYVANGTGSGITTTAPTALSINYLDDFEEVVTTSSISVPANMSSYSYIDTIRSIAAAYDAVSIEISIIAGSGANVFVNSTKLNEDSGVYSVTTDIPESTQDLRIIVQSGTNLPYLFLLK